MSVSIVGPAAKAKPSNDVESLRTNMTRELMKVNPDKLNKIKPGNSLKLASTLVNGIPVDLYFDSKIHYEMILSSNGEIIESSDLNDYLPGNPRKIIDIAQYVINRQAEAAFDMASAPIESDE